MCRLGASAMEVKAVDEAGRSLIAQLTTPSSPSSLGRSRSRSLPSHGDVAQAIVIQIECTERCCVEATAKDCAVGSAFHAAAKAMEEMAKAAVRSGAWAARWLKEATELGPSSADEAAVRGQVVQTIVHRERCEDSIASLSQLQSEFQSAENGGGNLVCHEQLAEVLRRLLVCRAACRKHIAAAQELLLSLQVRRAKLQKHASAFAELAGEDPLHMEPALTAVAAAMPAAIRAMKVVEDEIPQSSDCEEALTLLADSAGTLAEILGGLLDTLDDLDAWETAGQLRCLEAPQAVRLELEELQHSARRTLASYTAIEPSSGDVLHEATRVLDWGLNLQVRAVRLLRSLPDLDTLVQTCVAAHQRQQLRDAATEYCSGQPEAKSLKGFLRWFHSDYSDHWFEQNLPRLCDSFHEVFEDAMRDEMLQSIAQQSMAAEKLRQMLQTQLELLGEEASQLESAGSQVLSAVRSARGVAAQMSAAASQVGEWANLWAQRSLATLAPKQAHEDEACKLNSNLTSVRGRLQRTTAELQKVLEEFRGAAAERRPCDMDAARRHVERAIECRMTCRALKAEAARLRALWLHRREELIQHLEGMQSLHGASQLALADPAAEGIEALATAAPLALHVIFCCKQDSTVLQEMQMSGRSGLGRVGIQDVLLATRRSLEALTILGTALARLLDTIEELDGWDVVPLASSAPFLEVPQALRVEAAVVQDQMKAALAGFCKNMPKDSMQDAVNLLERAWMLQQRLVLLLSRLPDEDTVMKLCVAAQQRGQLHDAAREYCQSQAEDKSLMGFLRWFHREYSDEWFQRNLPRLQDNFPEVYAQAVAEHDRVAASQA
mmetsp:Transcript_8710/g.15690  ORF Transcript_8710/g.15690 Transcript_8710/m.15690 type:complete len:835 (-) Transcript_8710:105-2609(-)